MFRFPKSNTKNQTKKDLQKNSWIFLGYDELSFIRKLRQNGNLDEAEKLLRRGEPTPAVLDELRKISSARVKAAKKQGNWQAVVEYLEEYARYAKEWRNYCIKLVNQEPPSHTASDKNLLREARTKIDIKK